MRGIFKTEDKAGESVIGADLTAETPDDVLILTAFMRSGNIRRRKEAVAACEFLSNVFRNRANRLKREDEAKRSTRKRGK